MTAAIPATIAITGAKGTNTALRPLDNDENPAARSFIAPTAVFNTRANVLGNISLEIPTIAKNKAPFGPMKSITIFNAFKNPATTGFICSPNMNNDATIPTNNAFLSLPNSSSPTLSLRESNIPFFSSGTSVTPVSVSDAAIFSPTVGCCPKTRV